MTLDDPITLLNTALEGRCRIERQLGEVGMAAVYLALDVKHNRQVALKVLKSDLALRLEVDSFLLHFHVMPYVEGESLRERLDREDQLPVDEAVPITTSVAEALDHAHGHGVIHRDIKPATSCWSTDSRSCRTSTSRWPSGRAA